MSKEKCNCELGLETDKRHPIYPDLCFYCGDQSPKFKDLKRPLIMTDTPQEIADECFDIYLTEMGIGIGMKERRLIISHENKRVKEACEKQREGEINNFLVWYMSRSNHYREHTPFTDVVKEYSENPIPHHLRKA